MKYRIIPLILVFLILFSVFVFAKGDDGIFEKGDGKELNREFNRWIAIVRLITNWTIAISLIASVGVLIIHGTRLALPHKHSASRFETMQKIAEVLVGIAALGGISLIGRIIMEIFFG